MTYIDAVYNMFSREISEIKMDSGMPCDSVQVKFSCARLTKFHYTLSLISLISLSSLSGRDSIKLAENHIFKFPIFAKNVSNLINTSVLKTFEITFVKIFLNRIILICTLHQNLFFTSNCNC